MEVVWTTHAHERQVEWEKKRGITREDVESLVKSPEQIVRLPKLAGVEDFCAFPSPKWETDGRCSRCTGLAE